jgi:glycosyltransferase involved in cell wall biosynthesis
LDLQPVGTPPTKRALLAYKSSSFRLAKDDPQRANFSHEGLGWAMVRALHELGYAVDVFDYLHPDPQVARNYDLFAGHMNINFTRISRQLPPTVPRIYLAFTLPWQRNNAAERGRLHELYRRRGVRLGEERIIHFDEDPAYALAHGIICTGNATSRAAFAPHPQVHPVRNAARYEPRDVPTGKNFDSARRHFLFYAGPGNVHKGLDLLLEIFPTLAKENLHLHVCQYLDPDFARVYQEELQHTPNIHVHGNVVPRSREFYAIVDQCAFLISPSCAEGGQGAVVEAMHQGLVPLVSAESTVDAGENGILLPSCSLPDLTTAVRAASALTPEEVGRRSRLVQADARVHYTEENFVVSFRRAVEQILQYHAGTN